MIHMKVSHSIRIQHNLSEEESCSASIALNASFYKTFPTIPNYGLDFSMTKNNSDEQHSGSIPTEDEYSLN